MTRMIELLLNGRKTLGKTLEIGAGCGYQAAVLAQLTNEVYATKAPVAPAKVSTAAHVVGPVFGFQRFAAKNLAHLDRPIPGKLALAIRFLPRGQFFRR
jgi:hypothetical protein